MISKKMFEGAVYFDKHNEFYLDKLPEGYFVDKFGDVLIGDKNAYCLSQDITKIKEVVTNA
jgi:hypothetical protein